MAEDEEVVEEEQQQPIIEEDIEIIPVITEVALAPPKYEVRPGLGEKFKAQIVSDIILSTMQEQLMGRSYRADQAPRWAKVIANCVRQRVQEFDMKRYKIIVQCIIMEMRGAGAKCGQRLMWDPETDDYIYNTYRNETLFCHTTCYGVYMY